MNSTTRKSAPATLPLVRCAVYTRKSTEEGLQQEFNSLDAQRASAEAFIHSQASEGWNCLPDRYDDGGFTGGNMERPALQRLLADIAAGKIDAVVTYKVDRLSRSLLDFAQIDGHPACAGVAAMPRSGTRPSQRHALHGVAQGPAALSAVPLCHDAGPYHPAGMRALSLLRLLRRAKAGLADLSVEVAAGRADRAVSSGQVQQLGRDPALRHQVLEQVRHEDETRLAELESERCGLERDLGRWQSETRRLLGEVSSGEPSGGAVSRLADLQARVGQVEQRLARIRTQVEAVRHERLDEAAATKALAGLNPAWEATTPGEQARLVRLLVSRVDYDGARGKVSITFHPLGLKTLAGELLGPEEQSA